MKLICTIGSISCDGVLAKKGDIFEVSDKAGESIIKEGDATLYDEPIIPTPEQEEPKEPGASMESLVDLSALNKKDTLELVKSTDDPDVIQAFLEQEQAGKNRQDVINALESKLQA